MLHDSDFPRTEPFQTKEEVDDYFSHDKIQCLICGKWFVELTHNHLFRKHELTLDEYREHFGLPWQHGLVGQVGHKRRCKASKQRYLNGQTGLDAELASHKALSATPRRKQPYDMRQRRERALAVYGHETPWQHRDYKRILERMRSQKRFLTDVCRDKDLPCYAAWKRHVENHPKLEARAKKIRRQICLERKKWGVN